MSAENSSGDRFTALARNLRELRTNKGLKQEDVANALGVATPTYSSWERGRTEPDISSILELARFFDVTTDRLLKAEPRPLRIGSWYPPVGKFHPIKNLSGIFTRIYPLIFNTLYYFDIYDMRFDIELIEAWRIGKESYTFYLRRGVRFHSGDLLELRDVKLSYDLFLHRYPFYRQFVDTVEEKPDEYAIKINLLKPLELRFLPCPYIIPSAYLKPETWDEDDECFDGTGPLKVAEAEQENTLRNGLRQPVTLECNDQYFGKIPSIQAIEFHKTEHIEPKELEQLFLDGQVDLAYDLDLKESDMRLEESDKYCIEQDNRSIISYYLILDRNSDICRDENVREAVDYAVDRDRIVKMLDIKTAKVLPATHLYLITREETEGIAEYNAEKARACWEKALSSLKKNQVKSTTLRVGSTHYEDPVLLKIIGNVVEQLKEVGIDAEQEEDQSKAHAFVEMFKFIEPRVIYNNLHSSRTSELPWNNNSERLDKLLDDISGMETYRQIQQELTEQRLYLPLLSRGMVISHINFLDTGYRFRATNAPYGSDIVHWRFL